MLKLQQAFWGLGCRGAGFRAQGLGLKGFGYSRVCGWVFISGFRAQAVREGLGLGFFEGLGLGIVGVRAFWA